MDARRLHPSEDDSTDAVEQIKALIAQLPAQDRVRWFVFNTGYKSVELVEGLRDTTVALLVRLRSVLCFYADPPPHKGTGRPRRFGAKFAFKDPRT